MCASYGAVVNQRVGDLLARRPRRSTLKLCQAIRSLVIAVPTQRSWFESVLSGTGADAAPRVGTE